MCRRLGKKHPDYIGPEPLQQQKYEKSHWNPKRPLSDTYMVRILNDHTFLRDVLWNPQCNNPQGISKVLTRSKAALYAKLEKYYDRAGNGK
jgi:hypothetical protein